MPLPRLELAGAAAAAPGAPQPRFRLGAPPALSALGAAYQLSGWCFVEILSCRQVRARMRLAAGSVSSPSPELKMADIVSGRRIAAVPGWPIGPALSVAVAATRPLHPKVRKFVLTDGRHRGPALCPWPSTAHWLNAWRHVQASQWVNREPAPQLPGLPQGPQPAPAVFARWQRYQA